MPVDRFSFPGPDLGQLAFHAEENARVIARIAGRAMTDSLLEELRAARQARQPCALVTVAETKGSVRRAAGAKMLFITLA